MTIELELPDGWPDGPVDEVAGELLAAAFAAAKPANSARNPACMRIEGGVYDMREIGMAVLRELDRLGFDRTG